MRRIVKNIRSLFSIAVILTLLGASLVSAQGDYFGSWSGYSDTDDTAFDTAIGTVRTTFDSSIGYGLSGALTA